MNQGVIQINVDCELAFHSCMKVVCFYEGASVAKATAGQNANCPGFGIAGAILYILGSWVFEIVLKPRWHRASENGFLK